ncbi:MAG: ABC transporter substrate-binding protein [Pseudomonadales bacterium]|nr:ABC transporter substrate-binding protein [Pseudomonadales bacterium]NRA16597.1 ABC transporter substrate-binding protein [Oceanospirillaceae bacterium]
MIYNIIGKKALALVCLLTALSSFTSGAERTPVKAAYIPLADHYAGIIAFEKYRNEMKIADYSIKRMKSWPLLRAYFLEGLSDMAFVMSPLAMDMYRVSPTFRWVGQMHRDGNALAINGLINQHVNLPLKREDRKPDAKVAEAYSKVKQQLGRPSQVAVPSLLATHMVVLYKYLKDHGKTLGIGTGTREDVIAIAVAPAKSPAFIKRQNSKGIPASFEQSLPWADVVETNKFGHVAWYSKDVLPWPKGHVECIALASDRAIKNKKEAINEVIYYIHQAGLDIEAAREKGGEAMKEIAAMIRKHIPEHNEQAIIQSLRKDLNVINYKNLNVEIPGMKMVMDLAVEGGILREPINLDAFTDSNFSTKITEQ